MLEQTRSSRSGRRSSHENEKRAQVVKALLEGLEDNHLELLRQHAKQYLHLARATDVRVSRLRGRMSCAYGAGKAFDRFVRERDSSASKQEFIERIELIGLSSRSLLRIESRFARVELATTARDQEIGSLADAVNMALAYQAHPVVRFAFQLGTLHERHAHRGPNDRSAILQAAASVGVTGLSLDVDRYLSVFEKGPAEDRDLVADALFSVVARLL